MISRFDHIARREAGALSMVRGGFAQAFLQWKAEDERDAAKVVAVMSLLGMAPVDAAHYAQEARLCVGLPSAYEAACTGRPFLLPRRGPA